MSISEENNNDIDGKKEMITQEEKEEPSSGNASSMASYLCLSSKEIARHTNNNCEIEIVFTQHLLSNPTWLDWSLKTGLNSLANDMTWDFLEDTPDNQKRCVLWRERNIKRIYFDFDEEGNIEEREDVKFWSVCAVHWKPHHSHHNNNDDDERKGKEVDAKEEAQDEEFTVIWHPFARTIDAKRSWLDGDGDQVKFWVIRDEIIFGLKLFPVTEKNCFYKSGWVHNFQEIHGERNVNSGKEEKKNIAEAKEGEKWEGVAPPPSHHEASRRWLQLRHWVLVWYAAAIPGFQYQFTTVAPPNRDGSKFQLKRDLGMCVTVKGVQCEKASPSWQLPIEALRLPVHSCNMDDEEEINKEKENASEEEKDLKQKIREDGHDEAPIVDYSKGCRAPIGRFHPHGMIQLVDLKVTSKGKKLILSNATVLNFWEKEEEEEQSENNKNPKNSSPSDEKNDGVEKSANENEGKLQGEGKHGNTPESPHIHKIVVERNELQRLDLECENEEEAVSWCESLIAAGAERGEVGGGCCSLC